MKEKRRLRRIKVGCKILDTHTDTPTHGRSTVVLDDLISLIKSFHYGYINSVASLKDLQHKMLCTGKTVLLLLKLLSLTSSSVYFVSLVDR